MTLKLKHTATRVEAFNVDGVLVHHEYDDYNNHRVRIDTGQRMPLDGAWRNYRGMSKMEYKGRTYYGVTDYYLGEYGANVFALIRGESI